MTNKINVGGSFHYGFVYLHLKRTGLDIKWHDLHPLWSLDIVVKSLVCIFRHAFGNIGKHAARSFLDSKSMTINNGVTHNYIFIK